MSGRGVAMLAKAGLTAAGLTLATAAFGLQATPPAAGGLAPSGKTPTSPPATAAASADVVKKGRELFTNWSCGSCHSLADAGASGHVGPELDGDKGLTKELVINRVTNGQGAMPSFGGQMTDQEIATIAAYVTQVAAK